MKKIFLFLCLALVTLVANAGNSPYDTKEKVIDRAKAIVARHVIHHKGGEFKDGAVNAKSVDDLEKLIKSDPEKKFKKHLFFYQNYANIYMSGIQETFEALGHFLYMR